MYLLWVSHSRLEHQESLQPSELTAASGNLH